MALINIIDQISQGTDDGRLTDGIFVDLPKAFDTIVHVILLCKLEVYRIRGLALSWFVSYLANRTQYVSIDNCMSNSVLITNGVHQGSILGPLLSYYILMILLNHQSCLNLLCLQPI